MCFHRGSNTFLRSLSFNFGGEGIELVSSYQYLGVTFSTSSLFLEMSKKTVCKAKQSLNSIFSIMINSKMNSWPSRIKLFETVTLSAVSHCLSIWGLRYFELIERVQLDFFKRLLNLPKTSPDYLIRLETGSNKLYLLIFKACLNWLSSILLMGEKRYPKICFNRLKTLKQTDCKYSWSNQVGEVFGSIDRHDLWEHLTVESLHQNKSELISIFERKLFEEDLQKLHISEYSVFYNLTNPRPQSYLLLQTHISLTRFIAQLRLSNRFVIKFSYGGCSYQINPRDLCTVCNLNEPENLNHIFFNCPIYEHNRCLLPTSVRSFENLISRLNNIDIKSVKQIGRFLVAFLKLRSFIFNE